MNYKKFGLLLISMALMLAACAHPAATAATLTYGLTLIPTGIDPHLNASSELGIPLTSVYDTLVYLDPTTHAFVAGLAQTWEISTDGLAYTFHLRSGVKFHDGTAFNAEAVCINLNRIANPENKSQKAAGMLGPYKCCEAPQAYTAILHFGQPYAPLLDSLSQVYFGMASPAALSKWGNADYQFHQVGTGPFKFGEYVPGDHLTLIRNPDYQWGPSLFANRGPAHLETINFKFYADPATRAVALESGEAQIMGEVLPQDVTRLAKDPRFKLYATPIAGQPLQFLLNTQRFPTDDARVRRALLLAVDRPGLVKAIFGGYSPVATGPLSAVTFGYSAAAAVPAYDPAEAARLLSDAGWQDTTGDGTLKKDQTPLSVDLVFPTWGMAPEVAQVIEANWKALGVKVNSLQAESLLALNDAHASGNYNAISLDFAGSDPDLLRLWFTSKGFYNWSKVNDPDLDALLNQGFLTVDAAALTKLYAEAQKRIDDQTLVIPVRDYMNLNMASAKVTGLRYNAQGWFPWLVDVALAP